MKKTIYTELTPTEREDFIEDRAAYINDLAEHNLETIPDLISYANDKTGSNISEEFGSCEEAADRLEEYYTDLDNEKLFSLLVDKELF